MIRLTLCADYTTFAWLPRLGRSARRTNEGGLLTIRRPPWRFNVVERYARLRTRQNPTPSASAANTKIVPISAEVDGP